MTRVRVKQVVWSLAILGAVGSEHLLRAQIGVGTWVRQSDPSAAGTPAMTMTVEACCNGGRRLIYRMAGIEAVMTVESPFDGRDVPVLVGGKPSGETMAIKLVDEHHTVAVVKMNGQQIGTSKGTLSQTASGSPLRTITRPQPAASPSANRQKSGCGSRLRRPGDYASVRRHPRR